MKIAIVFDDLVQFGGAEKLLLAAHEIWPKAPIYTSVASKEWQYICAQKNIKLHTSFMQKLPWVHKLNRFYAAIFLHALAFESFDLTGYDVVLSISARFSHGVVTCPSTKHICYMNSPGRMFWEPFDYFEGEFGGNNILKKVAFIILAPVLSALRFWDYAAAARVDKFIANSKTPQKRIRKYYGRNSTIIYPFVDLNADFAITAPKQPENERYFVILSRLVAWKKIDIAVKACTINNIRLKVIGSGPHLAYLKKIAGPTIEFCGYMHDDLKNQIIKNSKALIVTQKEDFGIAPLEAMALGKPVIAFKKGGVLETVIPGKTGEFFDQQTEQPLSKVLLNFDELLYDPALCLQQAQRFSKALFIERLETCVSSVYLENKKYVL